MYTFEALVRNDINANKSTYYSTSKLLSKDVSSLYWICSDHFLWTLLPFMMLGIQRKDVPMIWNIFGYVFFCQAITCFVILGYIHNAFSRTPINCLDQIKDQWPRDGVLRVVISRNAAVSRLSENDTTRTNFTNSANITENILVNISNVGANIKSGENYSSSVGNVYDHSSNNVPQNNHLPVKDTVVPSAFELLAPIKIEGRL